jgi:hypothetical protein
LFAVREGRTVRLIVMPAEGGPAKPIWSFEEPAGNRPVPLDWLPDASALLVARSTGANSELWLVPTNGEGAARIDFPEMPLRTLRLSPDGKTLACVSGTNRTELRKLKLTYSSGDSSH